MAATKAVQRPHWYRVTVTECPGCSKVKERHERVYGNPPRDDAERYFYHQAGCIGAGCYSWL